MAMGELADGMPVQDSNFIDFRHVVDSAGTA
jgi:hypothetical protein